MSMTDYEIAVNAGRTILCSLEADGRLRFLSQSQRDVAVMMQDFFANRALELRATEKEAETPPTDLDERFGLEALAAHQALLRDANVRIKALGKLVDTVSMEGARKRADLQLKIGRLEEAVKEARMGATTDLMVHKHRGVLSGPCYFPGTPTKEGEPCTDPSTTS